MFFYNRYFQCEQNHGLFAPVENVKLVSSEDFINDSKNPTAHPESDITHEFKQSLNDDTSAEEVAHNSQKTTESSSSTSSSSSSNQKVLNKTFDLIEETDTDTAEEMIESRLQKPVETKILRSGLAMPKATITSSSLGSRSTSSTCSTSSASSSSSSSSSSAILAENRNLHYQMKLNRYSAANTSNTSTPNNKQNVVRQSSVQSYMDTNSSRQPPPNGNYDFYSIVASASWSYLVCLFHKLCQLSYKHKFSLKEAWLHKRKATNYVSFIDWTIKLNNRV